MKFKRVSVLYLFFFLINITSQSLATLRIENSYSNATALSIVFDKSSNANTAAAATKFTWSHTVSCTITNKMLVVAVVLKEAMLR